MRVIFDRQFYLYLIVGLGGLVLLILLFNIFHRNNQLVATAVVERGDVREIISVSGFVKAKDTADLAFPTTGIVTEVFVEEGNQVETGAVLATQAQDKLIAAKQEALSNLQLAEASLAEATTGASKQERVINQNKLDSAEATLKRTTKEQNELVESARRTLFSTDLEAVPEDPESETTPPTITGTYTCEASGSYRLHIFTSGEGVSSRNFRITGLENKNGTAYEETSTALGDCGLSIQIANAGEHTGETWYVSVPNTRSDSYVTNYNAYQQALQNRDHTIEEATENLDLITSQVLEDNESDRPEIISQRQASVDKAKAEVAKIDAEIADLSIVAPFSGIVTKVSAVKGETVGTTPLITVLTTDHFEVTARIPEIDIRKIANDQLVHIRFDAAYEEVLDGRILYTPLEATEIDGVAYFEAMILLENAPDWMRSGLNADIDIITTEQTDTLRLPKRFVKKIGEEYFVWQEGDKVPVEVLFVGNNGYYATSGLTEGAVVELPLDNE